MKREIIDASLAAASVVVPALFVDALLLPPHPATIDATIAVAKITLTTFLFIEKSSHLI